MAYFREVLGWLVPSIGLVLVVVHSPCVVPTDEANGPVDDGSLRLVGGETPEEGRVEIYVNGAWGTVCDDGWTIEESDVVCYQLGFGPAAAAPARAYFGEGNLPILVDDIRCAGDETALLQCQFSRVHNCQHSEDASAVCTQVAEGDVRLVDGVNRNEGNIEVYLDGQWGSVCDGSWNMQNTEVVCKQLGFSDALEYLTAAHFGLGKRPVLMDNISCSGDERRLTDCAYTANQNCDPNGGDAIGIRCDIPDDGSVRLLGGQGPEEGRIEIFVDGEWGSVCDSGWDLPAARVVCRQLGFHDALTAVMNATYGKAQDPVQMGDVVCLGEEAALLDCQHTARDKISCSHAQDAGVVCQKRSRIENGDIRLVNGDDVSGTVEVYLNGAWGTICDDNWGIDDANVVCRQLGFIGATSSPGGAHFGQGGGMVLMDEVGCIGLEQKLVDCSRSRLFADCAHDEDAGVVCTNGTDQSPPRFRDDDRCGGNYHIGGRAAECDPEGRYPCCSPYNWCGITFDHCDCAECIDFRDERSLIRLAGGNTSAGRVEVYSNGEWRTVCDDDWGVEDANVTCRQLGYREAIAALGGAHFGEGVGPTQIDGIGCSGQEERLVYCPHLISSSADCGHGKDAGVVCFLGMEERRGIRLANGNDTAGRVEVYLDTRWGTVCDNGWDIDDARVACRQLGFTGASFAASEALFGEGDGPTHMGDVSCSGSEERLVDCPHSGTTENCNHNEDAGVVCHNGTEEYGAIRIVNGDNVSGTVEVYLYGAWGTICDDNWGIDDANVVCRQLGFIGAISSPGGAHFGQGVGAVLMDEVGCTGLEQRLVDCSRSRSFADCAHDKDAGVVCTNGTDQSPPRFRDDNRCGGDYHIGGRTAECDPEGIYPCCSPYRWCGITSDHCDCADCIDYSDEHSLIRLADGNDTAGRVEVRSNGEWRTVCDDDWGMEDAHVACRQLGYREAIAALGGAYFGEGVGPSQMDDIGCSGQEERLVYCPHLISSSPDCGHSRDAGVVCFLGMEERRGIRLANGNDTAGRVEVYLDRIWGTVCDDHWDIDDARVACRQLGFTGALSASGGALFGEGDGLTQMDDVKCSGSEERLLDCPHVGSTSENCGHHEDAGVVCYNATEEIGAIRLVRGNNTSGRVEIYLDGQWGTVCDDLWDIEDADVVCRQLGFHGAISAPTGAHFGEGEGLTQMDNVECIGDEERLMDCAHTNSREEDCGHYEDAGVVCVARGDL